MSTELIAIISMGVALAGLGVTVAGLLLTVLRGLQKEMQSQREEMQSQREITTSLLGRVAHVEGLLEGLREVFTGRRADAVAEDPEGYGIGR